MTATQVVDISPSAIQHNNHRQELDVKLCAKCGIGYPPTRNFFYGDNRTPTGLTCYCKTCQAEISKARETANPERRHWYNMIWRCHYPSARNYRWYGAKGVKVCDRWRESFEAFLLDVGPRPAPGYTLSRNNDQGDYEPGNVTWAPWADQHALRVANRRKNMYVGDRYPCGRLKIPHNRIGNYVNGGKPSAKDTRQEAIAPVRQRVKRRRERGLLPQVMVGTFDFEKGTHQEAR